MAELEDVSNPEYLEWQGFSKRVLSKYNLQAITVMEPTLGVYIATVKNYEPKAFLMVLPTTRDVLVRINPNIAPLKSVDKVKLNTIYSPAAFKHEVHTSFDKLESIDYLNSSIKKRSAAYAYSITELKGVLSRDFRDMKSNFETYYKELIDKFRRASL